MASTQSIQKVADRLRRLMANHPKAQVLRITRGEAEAVAAYRIETHPAPETYASAKHIEAHLLDAHGLSMMCRESLADLVTIHDELHSDTPPAVVGTAAAVSMRRPHVHKVAR